LDFERKKKAECGGFLSLLHSACDIFSFAFLFWSSHTAIQKISINKNKQIYFFYIFPLFFYIDILIFPTDSGD